MKYLLDSNIISEFYDKFSAGHHLITQRLTALSDDDMVYMSILTLYELEYGYAHAPDDKKAIIRQKIKEAQGDFTTLPLSPEGAHIFGILKQRMKASRKLNAENIKKHNIDVMLAATALTEDCIFVSDDAMYAEIQTFEPALQIENWLQQDALP